MSVMADSFNRVADKIEQGLLDLQDIHKHRWNIGREGYTHAHFALFKLWLAQCDGVRYDAYEGDWRAIASIEPYRRAQTTDHFTRTINLRHARWASSLTSVTSPLLELIASATKRV